MLGLLRDNLWEFVHVFLCVYLQFCVYAYVYGYLCFEASLWLYVCKSARKYTVRACIYASMSGCVAFLRSYVCVCLCAALDVSVRVSALPCVSEHFCVSVFAGVHGSTQYSHVPIRWLGVV